MSRALSQAHVTRKPAAHGRNGVVVSQNRIASEIGAEAMRAGGNAVDAAIAMSFALGVVEPWMSGIGGGGYMMIRRAGETHAQVVDFGMKSPAALRVEDYPIVGGKASDLFPWPNVKDDANIIGARAVAIPGLVAGMAMAHETWGSQPWAALIAPAIAEAREGVLVDWYCQLVLASAARDLAKFPGSRATFLDPDGLPKSSTWSALSQTRCDLSPLAATLEHIAAKGGRAFYEGPLAGRMVRELQAEGGRHSLADFARYAPRIYPASRHAYRNHTVFGTPMLTAGPTLEKVLDKLTAWRPSGDTPDAAAFVAYDTAIRAANAERLETMGDVSEARAPSCTTHFNVIDGAGTMVAVTQTNLSMFGSRLLLPETGVLMNNGIMWFDPAPGKPNSIGPDKTCLSNMCPTLVQHADGRAFAVGAAGGRRILPAVAQLVSFLLDYEMDVETAMHSGRIDCSMAGVTLADPALDADVLEALQKALPSLSIAPRTAFPFNFACPGLASSTKRGASAAAELMAPWAEAVAV